MSSSAVVSSTLVNAASAVLNKDTLFLISSNHQYLILDTNFATIHSSALKDTTRICTGLAVNGNDCAIISDGRSDFYKTYTGGGYNTGLFCGVTTFPKLSNWNYDLDIGVTEIHVDSAYFVANSVPQASVHILSGRFQFKARVKNFGNKPVTGFNLNFGLPYQNPNGCYPDYFHRYYYNSIAPGQTVEVSTGTISVPWIVELHNTALPATYSLSNITLYTTLPSEKFDAATTNDEFTFSSSMPVVVSSAESEKPDAGFSFFPNPAKENIRFTSNVTIKWASIFAIDGKLIRTRQILDREAFI